MFSPRRENASVRPSGDSAASRAYTFASGNVSVPSDEKKATRQLPNVPTRSRSALPTSTLPSAPQPHRWVDSLWRDSWRTRRVASSISNILFSPSREER